MLGNVWEWCADWYDEKYYASSPAADPPGAPEASYRVIRGGSWYRTPGTAARRTATGTCRRPGTHTWASAWPQSRNKLGTEPSSGGWPASKRSRRRAGPE